MSYATKANVAIITGKDVSAINDFFLNVADREVERVCNRDFEAHTGEIEYFDTKRRNVFFEEDIGSRDFPLSKWPVTAVSEVALIYRNTDANQVVTETESTLVADDTYFLDNLDRGAIVKLSQAIDPPIGHKSIKVTYNWGYSEVPDDVKDFADYYAASLVEAGVSVPTNADGAPLSELELGRYREKYANPATVYKGKYGTMLEQLKEILISRYKFWE